jgi:HEAT repeat protein
MTPPLKDLKQWPTSFLVDRFIAVLSPFGTMSAADFLPIQGLKNRADDFKRAVEEARALAKELDRRGDYQAGDRLLSCPNPAVRLGIFCLLLPDAPREMRVAAMIGPLSGLPDETAGELFLRALSTKDDHSSLAALSEDDLLRRFEEFCLRNFIAWNFFNLHADQEQIDASNSIMDEIMRILVALKERNAVQRLVPLLKHENQNIRLWAAEGVLFVNEEAALATLAGIADEGTPGSARMYLLDGPGLTNSSAMRSLKRWRNERRGVYGLKPGDKPRVEATAGLAFK